MSPATDGATVTFTGVSKRYPGSDTPAVSDLNLTVAPGELVMLVGPSGCGKTTTLRMVNRLVEPTSGTVSVNGVDVATTDLVALRRTIGYVIQDVGLFPHRTVAANIGTVPRLLGWPIERITARVAELAEMLALPRDLLDRFPSALSGGQQQRVGVARALAADPPLLLMDEPFSAVDPVVRARLQDDIADLHSRLGTTILFVTHDVEEALALGDRIVLFAESGGTVAQVGTPEELLSNPASPWVSRFLGDERTLRRLSVLTLRHVMDPDRRPADTAVSLRADASVRRAVDLLLASGTEEVAVTDDDAVVGTVRWADIAAVARVDASGNR